MGGLDLDRELSRRRLLALGVGATMADGDYAYSCMLHRPMTGAITVQG
jgi:hypothetical protein